MTIDQTGQRANDTGWTKDARRAAKKAESKAKAAAFWTDVRRRAANVWDFFLKNLVLWLAIAALIGLAAWEWWNTSRGWANLYPAAGQLIYAGAIGAVGLYFFGFREWQEFDRQADVASDDKARSKAKKKSFTWLTVTAAAYLVCVAGVFIATATAAESAQRVAKDSRTALNKLVILRDDLAAKVELNDPALFQLSLEADQRTLSALVETAKGTHGMADLDMGSGCPAPPKKFFMERLCVQANGGIDPFNGEVLPGIRSEIKRGELVLQNAQEDATRLEHLNTQIRDFPLIQGDETADALGDMFSAEGGTVLSWLLLFLSSAFLYGGGWLGDWVLERVEAMRAAARAAKAART